MILGMSLSTFVTVHVIISLIGIVAGNYRHVRAARLQPDAGPDRDIPAVHDSDQRHRFSDSASADRERCCRRT